MVERGLQRRFDSARKVDEKERIRFVFHFLDVQVSTRVPLVPLVPLVPCGSSPPALHSRATLQSVGIIDPRDLVTLIMAIADGLQKYSAGHSIPPVPRRISIGSSIHA